MEERWTNLSPPARFCFFPFGTVPRHPARSPPSGPCLACRAAPARDDMGGHLSTHGRRPQAATRCLPRNDRRGLLPLLVELPVLLVHHASQPKVAQLHLALLGEEHLPGFGGEGAGVNRQLSGKYRVVGAAAWAEVQMMHGLVEGEGGSAGRTEARAH